MNGFGFAVKTAPKHRALLSGFQLPDTSSCQTLKTQDGQTLLLLQRGPFSAGRHHLCRAGGDCQVGNKRYFLADLESLKLLFSSPKMISAAQHPCGLPLAHWL